MRITWLTAIILTLAFLAVPSLALHTGDQAPAFDLNDQFDKLWSLNELKGNVVVVVAATPKSGEAMDPWIKSLGERYGPQVTLVGMMDLHCLPGIIRCIAKARIKKCTDQPLMLDFSGETSRTYRANDRNPVVVVIDRDSKIQAVAENHTEETFQSVTVVIDRLLETERK